MTPIVCIATTLILGILGYAGLVSAIYAAMERERISNKKDFPPHVCR